MSDGFDWLLCPHCREPLQVDGPVAHCAHGHSYDLARHGYLNLLGRAQGLNADSAEMVARRDAFLARGHYVPIAEALVTQVGQPPGARILEVGAGTGWYLARVLDTLPEAAGLGMDVSVPAARRLARCHGRARAVVADAWQPLPLRDGCCDVLLSVFAPRNPAEFARVLAPAGRMVTVTPRPGHLRDARERLTLLEVEPDKGQRMERTLGEFFDRGESVDVDIDLELSSEEMADLVGMGPNAHHAHKVPEAMAVRAEVAVTTWHPRGA